MTRREAYGVGLVFFLATIGMTIAAIIIPEWINWEPQVPGDAPKVKYTYGLHTRCTTLISNTTTCTPFPQYADCAGNADRTFCSLWRTTGFLLSAAVVAELAALVAFAIPLFGGKQKRRQGWMLLCGVVGISAACHIVGTGIIAGLHDRDSRFFEGWVLGRSFALCVASGSVQLLVAVGMAASVWALNEEGGYELIPDAPRIGS